MEPVSIGLLSLMGQVMTEPNFLLAGLNCLINLTYLDRSSEILYYKEFPLMIEAILRDYSINEPESEDVLSSTFWVLGHLATDSTGAAARLIDNEVLDTLMEIYK